MYVMHKKCKIYTWGLDVKKMRFFLILVVVSCERIIRKNVTRIPHNVIRFLGLNWTLFGVSFFSRVYAKLDFSLSILCFLEVRV